jgi:chromosome segregation ATPase
MSNSMIEGRRADSARRCQRVIKAINTSRSSGAEISVSAIARLAGVDRSFLYRHKDLLAQIHTAQIVPVSGDARSRVTSESLKADLANAQQRIVRLAAHNRQLERRLSEMLGEQAWRESGLGAPADVDQLRQQIVALEQANAELRERLEERDGELDAARAANRELISTINKREP